MRWCGVDRIDSRDLIETLDDLEERDLNSEETELYNAIHALADAGIEDWQYGALFIREDEFEDYARELADDIGALPLTYQWPTSCIDWTQAARELATDYTTVEFLDHTYYVRP